MIKTVDLNIWGRIFSLDIMSNFFECEELTKKQIDAVDRLLSNLQWIEQAKKCVIDYCKWEVENDKENLKKDNIFSYVQPKCIFVEETEDNPRVALMLHYRYDPEHGLAIVFDSQGNAIVGIQDIII